LKLVLFFTEGMSIAGWNNAGILNREVSIYKRLVVKGIHVSFVTYGNGIDLKYSDKLSGIKILCNKWGLPKYIYKKYLHIIHRKHLKSCSLIKTNQMFGADIALKSAKYYKKPLVNRMGYMLSDSVKELQEFKHFNLSEVVRMEKSIFGYANKIVVTTNLMKDKIKKNYPSFSKKLNNIPNFVDVDLFYPDSSIEKQYDILFIGRFVNQKNISNLLKSIKNSELKALLIGNGPLKNDLMKSIEEKKNRIDFIENISNEKLPRYMNKSKLFILPSFYEGHPKALIEAMSCEMTVIVSNVQGNNDVVIDGKNGFLCDTSIVSIQETIIKVLKMSAKNLNMINVNARQFVKDNYSLDKIVTMEMQLYEDIMNENNSKNLA